MGAFVASSAAASWHHGAGWWGHVSPHILVAAIVTSVVLVLRPLPPSSPAAALTPALLVGVVLVTWGQMRRHDRTLCERCMASMPLDASASAHRYRRRLATAHLATNRAALIAMVGMLLASDLALVLVPPEFTRFASLVWAMAQLSLVYLVFAHTTHRRLQPWCPRCRGGGGGDEVSFSDPAPSGSSAR